MAEDSEIWKLDDFSREVVDPEMYCTKFNHWKAEIGEIKKSLISLQKNEKESVSLQFDILQHIYVQTAYFVALSSIMALLFKRAWGHFFMYVVLVTIITSFLISFVGPVILGWIQICRIDYGCQEIFEHRKKLRRNFSSTRAKRVFLYGFATRIMDTQDRLLKEIIGFEKKDLIRVRREHTILLYQAKWYPHFILLMGLCGLVYATMILLTVFNEVEQIFPLAAQALEQAQRATSFTPSFGGGRQMVDQVWLAEL